MKAKRIENIIFTLILIGLFSGGYWAGYSRAHNLNNKTDTLIFRSHNSDSVNLHVVLKDGGLQSFWYTKKYYK